MAGQDLAWHGPTQFATALRGARLEGSIIGAADPIDCIVLMN